MGHTRPALRDAGKQIGAALGTVPNLRMGLELAGALLAPARIIRGGRQLQEGLETGDAAAKAGGKLRLASGLMPLAPERALLALVPAAVQMVVSSAAMSPERANHVAGGMLAASAGPVGMV